jgi:cytochrome P450
MKLIAIRSDKLLAGEIHRRQRKVMAAAFSVPHLKTFLAQFQVTASKVGENARQTGRQTG